MLTPLKVWFICINFSVQGNAHIFLGEFERAAEHYKMTLQLAQELGDRAVEAQVLIITLKTVWTNFCTLYTFES